MRYLEKSISKGNVIDLLGSFFYQLGYVKENEEIVDIELVKGNDLFVIKMTIETELEVKLIEHSVAPLLATHAKGGA